jgi:hypothetical protein
MTRAFLISPRSPKLAAPPHLNGGGLPNEGCMQRILLGGVATVVAVIGYAGLDAGVAQTASSNLSPGQINLNLDGRLDFYGFCRKVYIRSG